MIEYMKISRIRSSIRDAIAGTESIRAWKMIYNCSAFLTSLNILPILRDLKIVEVTPRLPTSRPNFGPIHERPRIIAVSRTTTKSKMFQPSKKYLDRMAMILTIASMVKMTMKM